MICPLLWHFEISEFSAKLDQVGQIYDVVITKPEMSEAHSHPLYSFSGN